MTELICFHIDRAGRSRRSASYLREVNRDIPEVRYCYPNSNKNTSWEKQDFFCTSEK